MTKPIVNAFSPDYVSQLKPERRLPFRLPKLDQPPRQGSLAPADPGTAELGKRYRLLKARI